MSDLLSNNSIALYFGDITIYSSDSMIKYLTEEEIHSAKKFSKEKEQRSFIIRRALLRILLSNYLPTPHNEIKFDCGVNNKPYLKHPNDLYFNMAQTLDYLVIGLSTKAEIGVDIEAINRHFDCQKLAPYLLSETELQLYNQLNDLAKSQFFLKTWTCKEAFFKAKGVGLSFPVNQLSLSLSENNTVEIVATPWDKKEKEAWQIHFFLLSNHYYCAVAVKERHKIITLHPFIPQIKPNDFHSQSTRFQN